MLKQSSNQTIKQSTDLQINEFLYPYLAFRNANTIEVRHNTLTAPNNMEP